MYEIDSEETTKVIDWPLTDKEEEFFLLKMEEYALKKEHCSLENLFQFEKNMMHSVMTQETMISIYIK